MALISHKRGKREREELDMPNWCNTIITLNCKDEKTADYVADKIENWTTKSSAKSDFGKSWLGNILVNISICGNMNISQLKAKEWSNICTA